LIFSNLAGILLIKVSYGTPTKAQTLLTTPQTGLQYPQFERRQRLWCAPNPNMNSSQNSPFAKRPSQQIPMEKLCRHPRVRVVAREEDAEFVECQECGDVFESSEFKDMAIEETIEPEET